MPDNTTTTDEEKATVDNQIKDFVSTPAPAQSDVSNAEETKDDAVLASAVNDLTAGSTPTPQQPVAADPLAPQVIQPTAVTPAPVLQTRTDVEERAKSNSVTIANKKIIEPLRSEPKPSLSDLLAAEQAKNIMTGQNAAATEIPSANNANPSATPPTAPPQPGSTFGPGNATPSSGFDASNITL
jgi:hypothetical protein